MLPPLPSDPPPNPPNPPNPQFSHTQSHVASMTSILPQLPPVVQLLMREADAWRALLQLHSGVLNTARHMAHSVGGDATLETSREAIEARESVFYSSLTQLSHTCDALAAESLKLRALRKARAATDRLALESLMQAHSEEVLGIGTNLASTASSSLTAACADLRLATNTTKTQIAQSRAFIAALQDIPQLKHRVLIGIDTKTFTLDEVFAAVFRNGAELSNEALTLAFAELSASRANSSLSPGMSLQSGGVSCDKKPDMTTGSLQSSGGGADAVDAKDVGDAGETEEAEDASETSGGNSTRLRIRRASDRAERGR